MYAPTSAFAAFFFSQLRLALIKANSVAGVNNNFLFPQPGERIEKVEVLFVDIVTPYNPDLRKAVLLSFLSQLPNHNGEATCLAEGGSHSQGKCFDEAAKYPSKS